ncbi:hypothetical protein ABQ333_05005 [Serratia fonticola]|uniref:hypothetical protein n=1 Tax=Serratia fonticola TaxID=47917 RepID=UPI003AAD9D23
MVKLTNIHGDFNEEFLSEEHLKYRENSDAFTDSQEHSDDFYIYESAELIKGEHLNES